MSTLRFASVLALALLVALQPSPALTQRCGSRCTRLRRICPRRCRPARTCTRSVRRRNGRGRRLVRGWGCVRRAGVPAPVPPRRCETSVCRPIRSCRRGCALSYCFFSGGRAYYTCRRTTGPPPTTTTTPVAPGPLRCERPVCRPNRTCGRGCALSYCFFAQGRTYYSCVRTTGPPPTSNPFGCERPVCRPNRSCLPGCALNYCFFSRGQTYYTCQLTTAPPSSTPTRATTTTSGMTSSTSATVTGSTCLTSAPTNEVVDCVTSAPVTVTAGPVTVTGTYGLLSAQLVTTLTLSVPTATIREIGRRARIGSTPSVPLTRNTLNPGRNAVTRRRNVENLALRGTTCCDRTIFEQVSLSVCSAGACFDTTMLLSVDVTCSDPCRGGPGSRLPMGFPTVSTCPICQN